ncbi:MAG: hypothetical protein IT293_13840, partial [Deltaproteobacteria bacterium]|nr:hypothetical protein [Deltaproteobacteria bacterium]
MVRCLDARNAGKISGDGQSLCLGASTPSGITAPTDPSAGTKLTKADAKLQTALDTKGAGLLTAIDSCGVTPCAVHDCLICAGWRRVVEAVRGAYGVP